MQFIVLAFAVLTIIGAFSAWRKSPLYSLKATLKLVGAFLLIVAATIGVSAGLLSSAMSLSPLSQGILGFIAIIAIGSGASIFVVRITDSHVALLAPSAKLVSFNRHKVFRWIWRLVVFLLINAIAALLVPASWTWLPTGIGGFVLLLCGPMLSILVMMAARNDRGMSAVIANPWAHWQYTSEQWAQWTKNQQAWEQAQEGPWKWKGVVGFILLCSALFTLGSLFSGGSLGEKEVILSGLIGLVILITVVAYWFKRTNFERRYRRLLNAAPETWFGDDGVFCNGQYMTWILSGRYLLKATAASGPPPCLTLVFQSFNGSSSVLLTQRIPIPDAHVEDLPQLQQRLRDHCPTASVHLINVELAGSSLSGFSNSK